MDHLLKNLPKYLRIKEAIRQEIECGTLKEGAQLPSERVLIERFSASKMTVIRALQELVNEGYLRRVQGKGTYVTHYVPETPLIGVLVPGTERGIKGIFPTILYSIEEQAHSLGYQVVMCSTNENPEKAYTFAERMVSVGAAGVIATPLERTTENELNHRWYTLLQDSEIPTILIDRQMYGMKNSIWVGTNNEDAMAEITREVLRCGHRRVLLLYWKDIRSPSIDARIRGFENVVGDPAFAVELAEKVELSDSDSISQKMDWFLDLLDLYNPTAIMTLYDHLALQVHTVLQQLDDSITEDISITGFDDLPFSQAIGLTTVRQPLAEEGRTAMQLIHKKLSGKPIKSKIIPSHVVLRQSLKPIRSPLEAKSLLLSKKL